MRHFLILSALLAGASPAQAQEGGGLAPGAVRLSQLRTASDDALVRLFFGTVRAFPYAGYRDRERMALAPRRISLTFHSQARATDRAGVCRTDRMTIMLEREIVPDRRDDPAMRPVGFDLQPLFIVENRGEARRSSNPTRRSPHERDAACIALDPRRDGIPAEHASQLMRALELTGALGAAAREGRAAMPIDCTRMNWHGDPPADEAACLSRLATLREDHVAWVQGCRAKREAPGGCIQVMTQEWWVEFDMNLDQTPRRAVIEAFEDMSQVNWSSG
jgi:hypothetical protein